MNPNNSEYTMTIPFSATIINFISATKKHANTNLK